MDHYFIIFSSSAMQQVLDNLKDLPSGTGAKDIDLIFLRGIMESPIVRSLAKVAHAPSTLVLCCVHTNISLKRHLAVVQRRSKCYCLFEEIKL